MFRLPLLHKLRVVRRLNHVLLVALEMGFGLFVHRYDLARHLPWHRRPRRRGHGHEKDMPRRLRECLERLGPVYVKFGQILSTRWDLLPREYLEELERLQAKVPPFSYKEAMAVVQRDFGRPVHKVFAAFEKKPFAAASLGQVYKAVLPSGEVAAVKVQRPNAKRDIRVDMDVLTILAHFIQRRLPPECNLMGVVREFRRWTVNELDYRKEATNCEIFGDFFKKDPSVHSPKVYWQYSRESVLALEFIPGRPLSEVLVEDDGQTDKKAVGEKIARSFSQQYFEYGFFHADPHPGNIIVTEDGVPAFLDFGMVGFLDERLTDTGAELFMAMIQKDIERMVALAASLDENYFGTNEARRTAELSGLRKELNELVLRWSSRKEQAGRFTHLFYELLRAAVRHGIKVPVDLIMLSKSVVTLDVVLQKLSPDLRIEDWEKQMAGKMVKRKFSGTRTQRRARNVALAFDEVLSRLPEQTAQIISNLERSRFQMELNAEQLMEYERLINANSRFNTYGLLIAGVVIATALLYQARPDTTLFGWPLLNAAAVTVLVLLLLIVYNKKNNGRKINKYQP